MSIQSEIPADLLPPIDNASRNSNSPTAAIITPATNAYTPFTLRFQSWMERKRVWVFGLIAIIYLAGFTGQWHPEPDSALYLTLGRNLAEGRGYTYAGQVNTLSYPGLPWLLAGTFKLFGSENTFAAHALMLLFTALALALTYRLIAVHADRGTAVVVTAALACCESFYRYAFEIRNDMPFLVGVLAFLVGYQEVQKKRWWPWSLMLVGLALAMIMRPLIWALLPAIAGAVIWTVIRGKIRWYYLLIPILGLTALACFFVLDPRKSTGGASYEQFILQTASAPGKMLHHVVVDNLPMLLGKVTCDTLLSVHLIFGLNHLVSITILVLGILVIRRNVLWGLWVLMVYAALLIHLPLPRYFLPILPILIYACWSALTRLNIRKHGPRIDWLFLGLILAFILPNVVRISGDILTQHGTHRMASEHYWEDESYSQLTNLIKARVPQNATVIVPPKYGRILTFLTRRPSIAATPYLSKAELTGPIYVIDQIPYDRKDPENKIPDSGVAAAVTRLSFQLTPVTSVTLPKYREFTLYSATQGPAKSQSP